MAYNNDSKTRVHSGLTLIELLIVIGIIGILAVIAVVALRGTSGKAKDAKRKAELSQMGRLLQFGCRAPQDGVLDIDLMDYAAQLAQANPHYQSYLQNVPRDPKTGDDTQSGYRFTISSDSLKCALYANLENENEPTTLSQLATPTPGGGTGVLNASTPGPNGTNKYYQVSN